MDTTKENCIEWITGDKTIAVTLSQTRYITKVEKLAEKFPDKVKIIARNEDGSIFAHLPLTALKLNIVEKNLTEDEKREISERLRRS